ncbi:MAG: hypothetical protein K2H01_07450 [Ruminococcus sp.]|nr:hypothetical protein [Ruminococcus sp.]
MVELYKRQSGKSFDITEMSRETFLKTVYNPIVIPYQLVYSNIMREALDYYKDAPLVKHELTTKEKNLIAKDPSYKQHVPEWEIEGYDSFVSDVRLDGRIRDEFYTRFMIGDEEIIEVINNHHPTLKAR